MSADDDESVLETWTDAPDQTLSYGAHADQLADVRFNALGRSRPLLVLLHGGFWKPEYDRAHLGALSRFLANTAWTVLTLEFRRIPGNPHATLDDIASALKSLPSQLQHHNGEVILIGHSAGGHLALLIANNPGTSMLARVIALAPVTDLQQANALSLGGKAVFHFLGGDPASHPDLDPIRLASPKVPVTIIHGVKDQTVPPGLSAEYAQRFPATRFVLPPDVGHFDLIDPRHDVMNLLLEELSGLRA